MEKKASLYCAILFLARSLATAVNVSIYIKGRCHKKSKNYMNKKIKRTHLEEENPKLYMFLYINVCVCDR